MSFGAIIGAMAAQAGLDWFSDAENYFWKKKDVDLANEQTEFNNSLMLRNAKNSAQVQQQSLAGAGLNPALAEASFSPSVSPGAGGSASSQSVDVANAMRTQAEVENLEATNDNLRIQNDLLKEQIEEKKEDVRAKKIENDNSESENESFDFYFSKLFSDKDGRYLMRRFRKGDFEGIRKAYDLKKEIANDIFEEKDKSFKSKVVDEQVKEHVEHALAQMSKLQFQKLVEDVAHAKTENERLKEVTKRFIAQPDIWEYIDDALDGEFTMKQGAKLALLVLVSALTSIPTD